MYVGIESLQQLLFKIQQSFHMDQCCEQLTLRMLDSKATEQQQCHCDR